MVWMDKDKLRIFKESKDGGLRKIVMTQAEDEILFNFFKEEI